MIGKARRLLRHHVNRVRLAVGHATELCAVFGAGEAAYDAALDSAFDFAFVHHIEDRRSGG